METININDHLWNIIELDDKEIKEGYEKDIQTNDIQCVFGYTDYIEHNIYINRDMSYFAKRKTLKHELMHCYIYCFGTIDRDNYTEEEVCDLCANSCEIINEIVNLYFKDYIKIGDVESE